MSKLNLTISYDRILKTETGIANEISKNYDNNNGVFVPPNTIYNTPLQFAIDNVDFSNNAADGKNKSHPGLLKIRPYMSHFRGKN